MIKIIKREHFEVTCPEGAPDGDFPTQEKAEKYADDILRREFADCVLSKAVLSPGEKIKLSDAFIGHRRHLAQFMNWELEVE
jgi:hypothetical protein